MVSVLQHHDVACPTCPEHEVSFALIATCQELLAASGPCIGPASYECPVMYFASLVPEPVVRSAVYRAPVRLEFFELARAGPEPFELARWENEGGAPAPSE